MPQPQLHSGTNAALSAHRLRASELLVRADSKSTSLTTSGEN